MTGRTDDSTPRYRAMGDPDVEHVITAKDRRNQKGAEALQEWVDREVAKAPPLSPEQIARLRVLLWPLEERPAPDLVTWRLRLFCGHVTETSTLASYVTVPDAFGGRISACPQCGLSPATIVAGRVVG